MSQCIAYIPKIHIHAKMRGGSGSKHETMRTFSLEKYIYLCGSCF